MSALTDTYPLTSLQQGMLFHSLAGPRSGMDIEQLVCGLPEPVNPGALQTAWEQLVARHAVLRTAFRWEGRGVPRQEVHREVPLPWRSHDWRAVAPHEQARRWDEFLHQDRARGFDPAVPPLLRVALLRFAESDHRLVWTFHHALLDGRSHPLLLRELFDRYDALGRGETLTLPPPPRYRDYVEWLQQINPARSEEFWRSRLRGFTAPTPLVVDRLPPDGAPGDGRQGDTELALPPPVTSALRAFARTHGVTMNTLVQGAWALLLSRYSGRTDVVFGATRAGRKATVAQADEMVGLCINTLPLRVPVDADARVLPWLRELRGQWLALREHEHTPLALVQQWSGLPRNTPLFQTLVVFEHHTLEALLQSQGGRWLPRTFRLHEQTNYPLTLAAYGGPALRLRLQFDRATIGRDPAGRMLGHLQTILGALPTADATTPLSALPMLTEPERRRLLAGGSRPPHSADPRLTLVRWFERSVEQHPDAVAVTDGAAAVTYGELNRRANRLAHHLRGCGVAPETLVGLLLERSVDLIVGLLGILKAGGAYVPLDPTSPAERLTLLLNDASPPLIVTQGTLLPPANARTARTARTARIVRLDDATEAAQIAAQPATNPTSGATHRHTAYVIYTSGSTGRPKGVLVTHRNVVRLFQSTEHWFHFDAQDVWTLFHSAAFDFSVWEIWGALLHGGRLVLVPHGLSRSPEALLALLARERVTVLNQTPSAFRQLSAAEESATPPPSLHLRCVIFGGEALDPRLLRPWIDRHGDERPQLINMFGITETTVHATYRRIGRADLGARSVIGVPLPDLRVYLLDAQLQPVPVGVPGELFVGGAGVARGYLRRPELTAARFLASPFAPGETLYRSGDLGRFLPDHDIEYLGRLDDQVKLRGFRIEPAEIETVLCDHPAVSAAVVLARPGAADRAGDAGPLRLIAYVVGRAGRPDVPGLQARLRARLPDYMVPSALVVLDRLPLTTNGKVDRRALPDPGPARPELAAPYVAARTPVERTLAGIWREVLQLERVGVDDNFFELGGNSLLLVQLLGQVRPALQADLAITDLFQHPTIRTLADRLARTHPARPADHAIRRGQRQAAALALPAVAVEEAVP